ncbi:hypothetical protein [Noviherbaspirillum autotrophicum]|uniref:Uncharacterized protein n=1 Tax=Noviherbaspirillum autotrophicum TaxID=709839 RepID=A0A0C1Y8N2_9BURK|nr:hypothetical protein [Noviherbaspirillum autotrophicum]KIF83298.1 hypothetical protein TSA66_24640 [Noviherbaspirillum autotrophicum]
MHDDKRDDLHPLAWLFRIWRFYFTLFQIAATFVCILLVFWGVYANRKKAIENKNTIQGPFWYIRFLSCCVGAYAIIFGVLLFIHAHVVPLPILDYWPLTTMLWADDSWYGQRGHANAIWGEPLTLAVLAGLIRLSSRIYGTYDDQLGIFSASEFAIRRRLDREILRLQMLHPENNGRFWELPDAERKRQRQEWKNKYGQEYELLLRSRHCHFGDGQ